MLGPVLGLGPEGPEGAGAGLARGQEVQRNRRSLLANLRSKLQLGETLSIPRLIPVKSETKAEAETETDKADKEVSSR